MKTTFFGQTGLRVSELCLGTMTFGAEWGSDEETSRAILDLYDEAGGSFVDTADAYGASETILGKLLEGRRERFVVATKYTNATGEGPNGQGNGRKNLRRSLDASLKRLRTDYVDVFWVHMWDAVMPIEETISALDDAVRAGKVLHVGFSDFPAWLVSRADAWAEARGLTRPAAVQVEHNLVMRDAERDLLPMADALGLAVCAWSPLGGGAVATGRASANRAGLGDGHYDAYENERTPRIAATVAELAGELACTPAQLAIAWCRSWGPLAVPIVGARTVEQARENFAAADVQIPEEGRRRLEEAAAFELGFPHGFLRDNARSWFGEEMARFDLRARPTAARTLGLNAEGASTTGAKSGRPRTSPMMYLADDREPSRVYVFASAAGADTNPAWFHNIVAHPNGLRVEIGSDPVTADAEVLPDPLRVEVYAVQASRYPGFAKYQAKTTRPIPVIALTLHR